MHYLEHAMLLQDTLKPISITRNYNICANWNLKVLYSVCDVAIAFLSCLFS